MEDFTKNPGAIAKLSHQPMWVSLEVMTASLIENPQRALAPLDKITDFPHYAAEIMRMEKPIATLGHRGETVALWGAIRWLAERARGAAPSLETREGVAAGILVTLLADAKGLLLVARAALTSSGEKSDAARHILTAAGSLGAVALLDVREQSYRSRSTAANREDRELFVGTLAQIGLPGLTGIVTLVRRGDGVAPVLLEELLDAMAGYAFPTQVPRPTGGPLDALRLAGAELAVKLFETGSPGVRRGCAGAIAGLLGPFGRPQLAAILKQETHDGPLIAAIEALQRTGGVDRDVVFDLDALLTGTAETSPAVRISAATALADAAPAVRPQAAGVLARGLKPQGGLLTKLVRDTLDPELVLAMAKSLLAIGGEEAVSVVQARADRSGPEAKKQLLALLPR